MSYIIKKLRSGGAKLAIKFGITAILFYIIFSRIHLEHFLSEISKQDYSALIIATFISFLTIGLAALRWHLILQSLLYATGHYVSARISITIFYICSFFSCCLPGAGSDVVRVWMLKSENLPLSTAIHSVVIDRIVALCALVIIVICTLPVLASLIGFKTEFIIPFLVVSTIVGCLGLYYIERVLAPVQHYRFIQWVLHFVGALKFIMKNPIILLTTLIMGFMGQVVFALIAFILAKSLSIQVSWLQCLTLFPPVILLGMIPISIGGWGLREAGVIGMLSLVGVPEASSLLLSLEIGIIATVANLPGSILWLTYRGKHKGEAQHA